MNIVLLNGWNMHSNMWQSLLPCLQLYGDVVEINVPYDQCEEHQESLTPPKEPQKIMGALCEHIVQQLPQPCVLVGWSLGGMLATHIAAHYPQAIIGVVTLATNVQFVANDQWATAMPAKIFETFYQSYNEDPQKTEKQFAQLVVKGDACRREQHRYLQENTLHEPVSKAQGLMGLSLLRHINNQTALQNIRCPSLHVFGEHDALVPASAVAAIQQLQAKNKHVQYHVVAHAGHLLHMPVDRLSPFLGDFLQKCQQECQQGSQQ
ncbi:alpha/beta fold hydrolase [Eionea flava]